MSQEDDLWYRIGFALERARQRVPTSPDPVRKILSEEQVRKILSEEHVGKILKKRGGKLGKGKSRTLDMASRKLLEAILTVGAGTFLSRFLSFWPGRRAPGLLGLGRAGVAGAAAAFLAELLRPALTGGKGVTTLEDDLMEVLLSGAGRGLIYAAIVEPRIPGPPALQGSIYAALEWALSPWGGLEEMAGPAVPHARIPLLSTLLQGRRDEEDILELLAYGIALAYLYED